MSQIIECIPNISEGNDLKIIDSVINEIINAKGVKLLHADSNKSANRTVITFAGGPDEVIKAAYNLVKKASELIDMRNHKGVHPRIGAVDVCPLVPLKNITIEDTAIYARNLAKQIGTKLEIPVYCYEYAALSEKRKNLANIRSGQYEGLKKKLESTAWKPDYGKAEFNPKTGAIAVGARYILVAYNININSGSVITAKKIAEEVRNSLNYVKAIGWYIEEFGCAQVSTNITDIEKNPIHLVFEEVSNKAKIYGVEVTGSEIIGLVPLNALTTAGKYYSELNEYVSPDKKLINTAITMLGLNDISDFVPNLRIIELLLNL